MFFGRDENGDIKFFMSNFGPATFERVPAVTRLWEGLEQAETQVGAGNVDAAKQALDTAFREGLDTGQLNESTINNVGYQYLQQNTPMAILVFQFNVEAYPDSWNVHDSYGEALALDGRLPEAIAAYKRSIALNPQSESGKAALQRLQNQ